MQESFQLAYSFMGRQYETNSVYVWRINIYPEHLKAIFTPCDFLLFSYWQQSRSMQQNIKRSANTRWLLPQFLVERYWTTQSVFYCNRNKDV